MEASSTQQLAGLLTNMAQTLKGVQATPALLAQTREQAESHIATADIASEQDAQELRRAYSTLLLACGLDLGDDHLAKMPVAKSVLTESLEQAHEWLLLELDKVFNLLTAVEPISQAALGKLRDEIPGIEDRPSFPDKLPSPAELEANPARTYYENPPRWWQWRQKPSPQECAQYWLQEASSGDFRSDEKNTKLATSLASMTQAQQQEFMQQQIYYQAAKVDYNLQDFYFARLGVNKRDRVSDELIDECERRFNMALAANAVNVLQYRELKALSAAEQRRETFTRMIISQCHESKVHLIDAAVNLQLYRHLATELNAGNDLITVINELKGKPKAIEARFFNDRPTQPPGLMNLNEIRLDALRDQLRLDEIYTKQ